MNRLLLLLLACLALASCTMEKRMHRPGFHVSWITSPPDIRHAETPRALNRLEMKEPESALAPSMIATPKEVPLPAHADEPVLSISIPSLSAQDTCDTLLFRSQERVVVLIQSEDSKAVRYFPCGSDGPLFIAERSELLSVKYADGHTETISGTSRTVIPRYQRRLHDYILVSMLIAIASFVTPVIGLLGGIVAIAGAIRGYYESRKYPERFKGVGVALAAMVLAILAIFINVLFILIIFSA